MKKIQKLVTRELTPDLWPALEQLFGEKGACGGCWCMYWRIERGESWEQLKGATNKQRFKSLVQSGRAHGVLAFRGDEPVGWCAVERRRDLPRLDRSRTLACEDAERVWSLPCFYVKAGHRGTGVSRALLAHALRLLRAAGAEIAEGYPVRPKKKGQAIPAAFAFTGTKSLFESAGFEVVGNRGGGKERMRRAL